MDNDVLPALLGKLRAALETGAAVNKVQHASLECGFDQSEQLLTNLLSPDQSEELAREARRRASSRLDAIERRRALCRRRHEQQISALQARSRSFASSVSSAQAKLQLHHLQYERRLRQQTATVTRRLQELAFECYGEMEKARLRSSLCSNSQQDDFDDCVRDVCERLIWSRFLERLQEDSLGALQLSETNPRSGRDGRVAFEELAAEFETELRQSPSVASQCDLEFGWDAGTNGMLQKTVRVHRVMCVRFLPSRSFDEAAVAARTSQRRARRNAAGPRLVHLCMTPEGGEALLCSLYSEGHLGMGGNRGSASNKGGKTKSGGASSRRQRAGGRPWSAANSAAVASAGNPPPSSPMIKRNASTELLSPNDDEIASDGDDIAATPAFRRFTLRGARRLPLFRAVTLLSAHPVQWLLGLAPVRNGLPNAQLRPLYLVGPHVYYCLDQRHERQVQTSRLSEVERRVGALSSGNLTSSPAGSKNLLHSSEASKSSTAVAAAISEFLESVYAKGSNAGIASLGSISATALLSDVCADPGSCLRVERSEGRHRHHYLAHTSAMASKSAVKVEETDATDLITQFPDVLAVTMANARRAVQNDGEVDGEGGKPVRMHFAPANVLQLLETVRFKEISERCLTSAELSVLRQHYPQAAGGVRPSCVGSLFVAVPSSVNPQCGAEPCANPLVGATLVPLSDSAIDELIAAFLVRNVPNVMAKRGACGLPVADTRFAWREAVAAMGDHALALQPSHTAGSSSGRRDHILRGGYALLVNPSSVVPSTPTLASVNSGSGRSSVGGGAASRRLAFSRENTFEATRSESSDHPKHNSSSSRPNAAIVMFTIESPSIGASPGALAVSTPPAQTEFLSVKIPSLSSVATNSTNRDYGVGKGLGHFCQWRACLGPSTAVSVARAVAAKNAMSSPHDRNRGVNVGTSGTKQPLLCAHHFSIRRLLDCVSQVCHSVFLHFMAMRKRTVA